MFTKYLFNIISFNYLKKKLLFFIIKELNWGLGIGDWGLGFGGWG